MPLDIEALLAFEIEPIRLRLTPRDVMLYALGVGFGSDPLDTGQLRYVYEEGLVVVPTHVNQMAGGAWLVRNAESFGIAASAIMQAEQGFFIDRPLPVEADLVVNTRVREVIDKGEGKPALVHVDAEISDAVSGARYARLRSTVFCRNGGGFGGATAPSAPLPVSPVPDREPDQTCDLPTLLQSALIYRLSGDYHKLHVDPDFARSAGFDRPILHGKCTLGFAGHALLRMCCDYDDRRLRGMACRFSSPIYPGEAIRTEIWNVDGGAHFRASVPARGVVVLDHGWADVAPPVFSS